jgi:hypothetical protein
MRISNFIGYSSRGLSGGECGKDFCFRAAILLRARLAFSLSAARSSIIAALNSSEPSDAAATFRDNSRIRSSEFIGF